MGIQAVLVVAYSPLLPRRFPHYHQPMRIVLATLLFSVAPALAAQIPGGIPWEEEPERRMVDKRPTPREWMIGVDGGRTNFLAAEFEEKATRFVGFVERNVLPWLGLQADLNCGKGTVRASDSNPQSFIGACTTSLSAVVPIPISYAVWPYLRVGAGYAFWDEQAVEGFWDVDASAPAFIAAVGARYFPLGNDKVALRVDIQRTQSSLRDLAVDQWGFGFGATLRIPRK